MLQGRKRAFLGAGVYEYSPEDYLCVTMPLPMEAEIRSASPDRPVLGMLVRLETRLVAETAIEYEAARGSADGDRAKDLLPGLAVVAADEGFVTATGRLLSLLDDPVALRVLGRGRLRELLFSVMNGPAGSLLRQSFGGALGIGRALRHLRENVAEPITVDKLARKAGMSRTVFHRRFKEVTTFSPLQFVKALRLSDAAMLLAQGASVSEAAGHAGYTSASQFSREFRRQFGRPPREWRRESLSATFDPKS
ncbi:MAG: AraC family transcriptional regulator, partial [Myxococcota bacterium]